jgi:MinD superfamily P-loop ATPase
MPELVVISANGGAGKTSVVASLAAMAHPVVLTDCNVSRPHLQLVVKSRRWRRFPILNDCMARIEASHCLACGKCETLCRFQAVHLDGPANGRVPKTRRIDPNACEGCGVCHRFCPQQAVEFQSSECGQWFVSRTGWGPMVYARLNPVAGGSGQLIRRLREKARELAARDGQSIFCDSPPGIGSAVVASLAGADLALIVTEATRSGLQGLERVFHMCRRLRIEAVVAINKWDLNEPLAEEVEVLAGASRLPMVGRVRYDPRVGEAQMQGESVVQYAPGTGITQDLRRLWESLRCQLGRIRILAGTNHRKRRTPVPAGC